MNKALLRSTTSYLGLDSAFNKVALSVNEDASEQKPPTPAPALPVTEKFDPQNQSLELMAQIFSIIGAQNYRVNPSHIMYGTGYDAGERVIFFYPRPPQGDALSAEESQEFYANMAELFLDMSALNLSRRISFDEENLIIALSSKKDLYRLICDYLDDEHMGLVDLDAVTLDPPDEASAGIYDQQLREWIYINAAVGRKKAEDPETFELLFGSMACRPFLSRAHYEAALTHNYNVHVPLSLDHLARTIAHEEGLDARTIGADPVLMGGYQ